MKVIRTKGEARQLVQASLVANGCTTIADVVAVQVEKGENLVGYHVTDVDDQDADGEWLDGARNYTLHIPPDAPAKLFWSLTLYEVDGRDVIHNQYKVTDRSSRMDLLTNSDGSVDLYFGPDEPSGKKQNWIPTEPGRAFFAMLRFYSPGQTLLDRSWILPNIEKAE